jgi:hypothetical protein
MCLGVELSTRRQKWSLTQKAALLEEVESVGGKGLGRDRSTLCDWVGHAAWLLDPVVAAVSPPARLRRREDPW